MNYKWYKGVTHCHTTASDGDYTLEQIIEKAKKNKLDYIMITDHNKLCDEFPEVEGLTLIYGTEYTRHGGHSNFWGVRESVDSFDGQSYKEFLEAKNEAKRRGAVICMNHPLCSKCTWRWPKVADDVDVLEVWNAPMHYDNMICTEWWHEQLRNGHKLPVVGGSDYHRDYVVTNLLPNPVTYVYAKSASPEDILDAIVKGRTTICNNVGSTFINITCGKNILGDTVKLQPGLNAKVSVVGMKKNHTLRVFDADGECFTFKAEKNGDYEFDIPAKEGFICAHVTFDPKGVFRFGYQLIMATQIPSQKRIKLPPFIYAQSGAIYFKQELI
ncbi:MAG: CehA/McbA family metallohydrolase [Clostridia bacterium]|nr:CehA/McbA family metallohydrolase [Clostridia bacterium]